MSTNPIEEKAVGDVVHEENYIASTVGTSHVVQPKSKAEKRLLLKADCVILPLAAFGYFAAYMVFIQSFWRQGIIMGID
jgi:hypothetical protein